MRGQLDGTSVELTDSFFVDADFFNIFTYEFVEGNPETAIKNPDSVVITEETAARIFGENSPLG